MAKMRKSCGAAILASLVFFILSAPLTAMGADKIETATGLIKLSGERFIVDLKYAGSDNFLKSDVYSPFGLAGCYVHPEMRARLETVEKRLKEEGLYLIVYDCYRPLEVQRAMWEIMPDARYVANPATGSLHNRGTAIDCALADESRQPMEFPTAFDSFSPEAWQSHQCPKESPSPCGNRDKLNEIMGAAGFRTIRTEWWHFQLPGAKKYPLLSLEGGAK
ncbi:hypothetical protein C4J81_00215 [Deltaproteobacteria bacterium Smac51]|nr:hypothetical protein C4J81_00215 [Deltaproteobacteria bacterium Smac51]